ncbi:unnamed protein product [Effrenium voratum]|nr:unnamed protein product [Effrenium voratum]
MVGRWIIIGGGCRITHSRLIVGGWRNTRTFMKIIDKLGRYDGLDLSNLAGAELAFRRLQLIEYVYSERGPGGGKGGSKSDKKNDYMSSMQNYEANIFAGGYKEFGDTMVAPSLLDYVAKEVEGEAAVLKQVLLAGWCGAGLVLNYVLVEFSGKGSFLLEFVFGQELDGKVKSLPRAVVRRIEEKHHVDEWGALGKLRTNSGYTCGPVHLAPMNVDLVSLPPKGSVAAPLSLVFEEEAENVLRRLMSKVSAEEVIAGRKANCGMDPLLRQNPRGYATFCRRLSEAGLIEHKEGFIGEVGAFTVWKKSGKQRLVIDARLANMHFETPDKVQLTTGSTFAS